jgi:ribosome maturation protein SDO1
MPQNINLPSNRISLTNISLVRYRKRKSRFELACYKNKLLEFRSGTETDLDNVLQVPTIFLNVSKGAAAPNAELEKCFGKPYDKDKVIREILDKGEIQVGAGERREERERLEREVLDLVGERLVDPATKRVYTTGIIRKALEMLSQAGGHRPVEGGLGDKLGRLNLNGNAEPGKEGAASASIKDVESGAATPGREDGHDETGERHRAKARKADMPMWTGVVTTKSAKIQALEAMKALIAWQPIPVMRARMRLRVSCPASVAKLAAKSKGPTGGEHGEVDQQQQAKGTVKDRILSFIEQVDSQDVVGEEWEVVGFVEPGAFKGLGEFVSAETKGRGRVEVLDMAVTHED